MFNSIRHNQQKTISTTWLYEAILHQLAQPGKPPEISLLNGCTSDSTKINVQESQHDALCCKSTFQQKSYIGWLPETVKAMEILPS